MASSGRAMAHLLAPRLLAPRLLAPLRASTSTSSWSAWTRQAHPVRQAHTDRYTTIHAFFTKHGQTSTPAHPPSIPRRFLTAPRRWNSSTSNHPNPPKKGAEDGTAQSASQQTTTPSSPRSATTASSSPSSQSSAQTPPCPRCQVTAPVIPKTQLPNASQAHPVHISEYSPFIRRLINRSSELSHNLPHRLTKEDLLNAAESWWQRLRIRLKWFFIRGWRRFNTDDLSAFFSWFVVGNTLWVILGTTTFVSAVFATLNSLQLQEHVARWISDYLTAETGVTVIFESAIVPKWGASKITFRNVYVSRRPQDAQSDPKSHKTQKGDKSTQPSPIPYLSSLIPPDTYLHRPKAAEADNYTMFDLNFDEIDVTLSFTRWLDGKGLVKDAKVKGVRGVIDRRSVWWDTTKSLEPADYRHPSGPGDFELENFIVEDFLVTVYHPGGQRPFNVSIFNAKFKPFRKRWLFYDMLSAESMTGQYDNCLFSLHMPQKLGGPHGDHSDSSHSVKRMARFRIDGLPIEHAQFASGNTGAISWITSGKLDAVLDIKFPFHPDDDDVDIMAIFEEIGRNVATITHSGAHPDDAAGDHMSDTIAAIDSCGPGALIPGQARLARPPLRAPGSDSDEQDETKRQVVIDIDLRFRDLKAAVPVFTYDLSVTNNALIRPIVAFINANRTLIPIHCQVKAELKDFDGSWTLFEAGLMSSISNQIYSALAHHVSSEAANSKRIRQVSVWGIQRGAEVLLDALKNMVDPFNHQVAAL